MEVLSIIGNLYDAALDPRQWPTVLSSIAELFKSKKALLFTPGQRPLKDGILFPLGIPDWALQLWETKYAEQDVWLQVASKRGLLFEGNVITDADLSPLGQFLTTAFYREFLSHLGIARMLSGVIFGIDSPFAPTASVCVYRDVSEREFGEPERAACRVLIPHLSRALGIMFRLRDAEHKVASSLAALDRISSCIVLLDSVGSVIFANRTALRVLEREDGLCLRSGPGGQAMLSSTQSPDAQRALAGAIAESSNHGAPAVSHFSRAVRIVRLDGESSYLLNLSALPVANEFGTGKERAVTIAFINDPDQTVYPDPTILMQAYGLTRAECRVAAQLCAGETMAVIAERLGIRESTVKTQLLSIFAKTGARRRVELIKLLCSLASAIV